MISITHFILLKIEPVRPVDPEFNMSISYVELLGSNSQEAIEEYRHFCDRQVRLRKFSHLNQLFHHPVTLTAAQQLFRSLLVPLFPLIILQSLMIMSSRR